MDAGEPPLLQAFPGLGAGLPRVSLCQLPTPLHRLAGASRRLGVEVYVKRDDASALLYGGNKPRKLEFLLGAALGSGAREVLTFGFAGSNHATATAVYAKQVGMSSISMLLPQPPAPYVRDNLLLSHSAGAELHHYPNVAALGAGLGVVLGRRVLLRRRLPMLIPAGGSSPLGLVGFVNAAFELRQQVDSGLMPAPARIYLAMGSMGSAAGLALGLAAAGLRSQVVAVQVVERRWASLGRLLRLSRRCAQLLHGLDPGFPAEPGLAVAVRQGFLGSGYGHFTPAGDEAASMAGEGDGIDVDGTYGAKAFAALIADARAGALGAGPVLFWNTSHGPAGVPAAGLYRDLPRSLHRYFGPL